MLRDNLRARAVKGLNQGYPLLGHALLLHSRASHVIQFFDSLEKFLLAKTDVKNAFRIICIRPMDYCLLGM